jgi:Cu+-exporting ATPase
MTQFVAAPAAPVPFDNADAAVCRHCGDSCGPAATRTSDGIFCCAGCASVFGLLAAHQLTGFYTCDVRPGRSQKAAASRAPDRFAVLDDPVVASRLVVERDGMARTTLQVPALHCASCLWLLEQLWRFDPGITRSEANLLDRTATVEFRSNATSIRRIAEQLAALGYEPVIDGEGAAAREPLVRRSLYLKLGVAGFAFGNVMLFSIPRYANGAPLEPAFQRLFDSLNVAFALPVLLYSASEFFRPAWQALRRRSMTLDVPIALGLAVLFARSVFEIATATGEGFLDSFTGLVFFLLIGRLFQRKAFDAIDFDRTMRSFLPLSVTVHRASEISLVRVETLRAGETIVVRPGEVVPADAVLLDAPGRIDYAFVTGEQTPVAATAGSVVHAGGRVVEGTMRLSVIRPVSQSRLAQLWSHPVFETPKRHWLDGVLAGFGWWFTVSAIALAAGGAIYWWPDAGKAATVATAVLIIACPCAFTLAAPITLGTAMGVLGRAGVYLKQPAVALDLSRVDTVVFDKTGTLTTNAADARVDAPTLDADALSLVQQLAAQSVHPVSRAIAGRAHHTRPIAVTAEVAGGGIAGEVDGHAVVLGSAAFVGARTGHAPPDGAATVWASIDGGTPHAIHLTASDRSQMRAAVADIAAGRETWLLSGDHEVETSRWAQLFGHRVRFRQSPQDKLAAIRERQRAHRRVLMVGDGLNDAGALAAADVGIAVSDDTACLVPACDAIVRGERLPDLPRVLRYARRARQVIVLCFLVSLVYNALGLAFALAGWLTPLVTAILMPVSSLTIVGLSTGLMRRGTREGLPS